MKYLQQRRRQESPLATLEPVIAKESTNLDREIAEIPVSR